MTLNITLLTSKIIYQSADFRISSLGSSPETFKPSPKTLEITHPSWRGSLTYTGLGLWDGRDMSSIVADWLTGLSDANMLDVARKVEKMGTEQLAEYVKRYNKRLRHTFTLAGFESGQRARVFVISNFEDCFSVRRDAVDDRLTLTTRAVRSSGKAIVVVTGQEAAVSSEARRALQLVAENYPDDSLRIRNKLQELNAAAVNSGKTANKVSEDCVVHSLRSDGSAVLQLNRDGTEMPPLFPHIMNGVNMGQLLTDTFKNLGIDLSQVRIVQGASATFNTGQESASPGKPCRYGIRTPDATAGYTLEELTSSDFQLVSCEDINDHGQVIGTGRLAPGRLIEVPWSWRDGQPEELYFAGTAVAINNLGQIAAIVQVPEGQRAALYKDRSISQLALYHGEVGIFSGSDSEAAAINSRSLVVGSMRSKAEETVGTGQVNARAAAFQYGRPTLIIDDLVPKHGFRAVDVNDHQYALVMAGIGVFDARSLLWNTADGTWAYVGDDKTNVYPIAINNNGTVLGQARNPHGHPVAVICVPGGQWQRLGVPDGWIPVDMNDSGEIVGRAKIDGLDRPWLYRSGEKVVLLPYLSNHHINPRSINNRGQIVGGADLRQ